ncbi:hypothetical protein [Streptomyces sp. NPDC088246]|uniref:hypothetical protein n=1 Tax=Streptomyces sp. NPDC088246 TaxID=3365842 RepID=UPI00380D85E2
MAVEDAEVRGGEHDDVGEVLAEQQEQGACRSHVQGQFLVVEALLEQIPVGVFVDSFGLGLGTVRDQQVPAVAAAGRPDEEVPQLVTRAGAVGEPQVDMMLGRLGGVRGFDGGGEVQGTQTRRPAVPT